MGDEQSLSFKSLAALVNGGSAAVEHLTKQEIDWFFAYPCPIL